MADSSFPTSIDTAEAEVDLEAGTLDDVDGTGKLHSSWMRRVAHALNRLQTKVGVDGSAVTTSHDYKLAQLAAIDALVGTATGALSGEIVVGTSPGGELGGTWASPTVDATHSGSSHASVQAAAEATAASALSTHESDTSTHGVAVAIVGTTETQTLTNKTLTTPTIGSFTNANHSHADAAGGGTLSAAAITSGMIAQDRLGTGSGGAGSKFLADDQTYKTVSSDPTMGGDLSGVASNAQIVAGSVGTNELATLSPSPAGTYGSGALVPTVVVDSKGRVTSASTSPIAESPIVSIYARANYK